MWCKAITDKTLKKTLYLQNADSYKAFFHMTGKTISKSQGETAQKVIQRVNKKYILQIKNRTGTILCTYYVFIVLPILYSV